jgi:hypothetical protein
MIARAADLLRLSRQGADRSRGSRRGPNGIRALREFPKASLEFGRDAFAGDPRIAAIAWER